MQRIFEAINSPSQFHYFRQSIQLHLISLPIKHNFNFHFFNFNFTTSSTSSLNFTISSNQFNRQSPVTSNLHSTVNHLSFHKFIIFTTQFKHIHIIHHSTTQSQATWRSHPRNEKNSQNDPNNFPPRRSSSSRERERERVWRRSLEEPGGARRSLEEPGGARRSQEESGGARRRLEEPGGKNV